MKSLTVRLPDTLLAEIEDAARTRRVSVSDLVRERLEQTDRGSAKAGSLMKLIGDLVGSARGLPPDLSCKKKNYLSDLIRAQKHPRR